jgi:TP901 family phage tail tape measure protein
MPDIAALSLSIDSSDVKVGVSELDKLTSAAGRAETATENAAREFQKMAAEFLSFAALAEEIHSATEEALRFSTAMADINTILPNDDGLARMTEDVKQLAIAFGKSPVEEARGLYQVISAGVTDATQQMELLNAANTLTIDGLTDQQTAVDAVTTLWATYGNQVGSITRLQDEMFATVAGGKLRMGDLAHSIGMVASIAAQAGVDLPSLFAAVDALTNSGISARRAIEGLREVLASVAKPSKEARDLARDLGINYSLAALKAEGLTGFIRDLSDHVKGNQTALNTLAGSVQAWAAIAPLAGTGAELYSTALDKISHSAGEAQRALQIMQASPEFQFKQLKAQFEVLQTNLGNGLVSAALPAVQALNRNFDEFAHTLKLVAEALSVVAAVKLATWSQEQVAGIRESIAAWNARRAAILESAQAEVAATQRAFEAEQARLAKAIEAAQLEQDAVISASAAERAAISDSAREKQAALLKTAEAAQAEQAALLEALAAADAHRAMMVDAALAEVGFSRAADETTASALASAEAMLAARKEQLAQVSAVSLPFAGGAGQVAQGAELAAYNEAALAGVAEAQAELAKAMALNEEFARKEAALAAAAEQAAIRVATAQQEIAAAAERAANAVSLSDTEAIRASEVAAAKLAATEAEMVTSAAEAARAVSAAEAAAATAASEASFATSAFKTVVGALGGPIGIATAAVVAGGYALHAWSEAADEALKETVKLSTATAEAVAKEAQLARDMQEQQRVLDDAKASADAHNSATEQMKRDIDALIEVHPEFARTFKDTADGAAKAALAVDDARKKLEELKKQEDELRNQRDNPELTSWQTFVNSLKAAFTVDPMAAVPGAAAMQDMAASEQAQLAENSQKSAAALVQVEEQSKKAKEALDALTGSTKSATEAARAQEQVDLSGAAALAKKAHAFAEGAKYLAHLQEEADAYGRDWEQTQKLSDGYRKLDESLKPLADRLLRQIELNREKEKQDEGQLQAAEQYQRKVEELNRTLEVHGPDRYTEALRLLRQELLLGDITFDEYSRKVERAYQVLSPDAIAQGKYQHDLDELEKQLKGSEELASRQKMVNELYSAGRISARTYYSELEKYLDQTNEGFHLLKEAATSISSDLTQGFIDFTNGTKDAFGNMVRSILADLERIAANKAFEQLLSLGLDAAASFFAPEVPGTDFINRVANNPTPIGSVPGFAPLRAGPIGQGALNAPVTVNLTVNSDGSADGQAQTPAGANRLAQRMAKQLRGSIVKVIQEEMEPGGSLYSKR